MPRSSHDATYEVAFGAGQKGTPPRDSEGMMVGGTRQLLMPPSLPPSLTYGASGTGRGAGNAILVFNVTTVSTP